MRKYILVAVFPPVLWQSYHLLGLTHTSHESIVGSGFELLVKFKTPKVRRIRTVKGSAVSPVLMDTARIGAVTTDFKKSAIAQVLSATFGWGMGLLMSAIICAAAIPALSQFSETAGW